MNAWWMPLWWRWLFDDFVLWHLGAGARDIFVAVWFGVDGVRLLWIYYWSGESNYYLLKRNREDLSHNSQISRDNVLIWNHRPLVLREFLHLNYISEVVDRFILNKGDYQKNCMQCLCPNSNQIYLTRIFVLHRSSFLKKILWTKWKQDICVKLKYFWDVSKLFRCK